MSEQDDKKPGSVDLELEWDDALADWEKELDERHGLPLEPKDAPAPFYRPPAPGEFTRPLQRAVPQPAAPTAASADDDEDGDESTRIAAIPSSLIQSTANADDPARRRPPSATTQTVPATDLDIEGMFDIGLERPDSNRLEERGPDEEPSGLFEPSGLLEPLDLHADLSPAGNAARLPPARPPVAPVVPKVPPPLKASAANAPPFPSVPRTPRLVPPPLPKSSVPAPARATPPPLPAARPKSAAPRSAPPLIGQTAPATSRPPKRAMPPEGAPAASRELPPPGAVLDHGDALATSSAAPPSSPSVLEPPQLERISLDDEPPTHQRAAIAVDDSDFGDFGFDQPHGQTLIESYPPRSEAATTVADSTRRGAHPGSIADTLRPRRAPAPVEPVVPPPVIRTPTAAPSAIPSASEGEGAEPNTRTIAALDLRELVNSTTQLVDEGIRDRASPHSPKAAEPRYRDRAGLGDPEAEITDDPDGVDALLAALDVVQDETIATPLGADEMAMLEEVRASSRPHANRDREQSADIEDTHGDAGPALELPDFAFADGPAYEESPLAALDPGDRAGVRAADAASAADGASTLSEASVDDDEAVAVEDELALAADVGGLDAELERDLDSLEPPPAGPSTSGVDLGAAAARRTVRARKKRAEHLPLVGRSHEARRARQTLLTELASRASETLGTSTAMRARLHLAAAELAISLGFGEEAREHNALALACDPTDIVALRASRRASIEGGRYADAAKHLEAEAGLDLSVAERRAALLCLAELRLRQLRDPEGAERAAEEASQLGPSVSAALIVAEARGAQSRPITSALQMAGDAAGDHHLKATLLVAAARQFEGEGERDRALALYRRAASADPSALDALLGRARVGQSLEVAEALTSLAERLPESPLRDAFARRAAIQLLASQEDPVGSARAASSLLESSKSLAALRTRALAALRTGDSALAARALESWASASGGTERAEALVQLAEIHVAEDRWAEADETLRLAALADGSLGTIRAVRALLARRGGDQERLAGAAGSPLAGAAKVAMETQSLDRERELIEQAKRGDDAPLTAELIWLDLAAAQGNVDEVMTGLRRQLERSVPEQRLGALLALTDYATRMDDIASAESALREALEIAPAAPAVLRPLGRLAMQRSLREAATLWLDEAAACSGARSAFAACNAGLLLESAEDDALGAYRRALEAAPGYGPALWSLEPVARDAEDLLTLHEIHEQQAQAWQFSAPDRAAHLTRAALLRAEADPEGAAALLAQARALAPNDTILMELVIRLGTGVSTDDRVQILLSMAREAPRGLTRALELAAAAELDDAAERGRAVELYRRMNEAHGPDPFLDTLLSHAERAAGQIDRLAERQFAAVRNARSDEERVRALERLADIDLRLRNDTSSAILSYQSLLEHQPNNLFALRALERMFVLEGRTDELISVEERLAQYVSDPVDTLAHLRYATALRSTQPGDDSISDAIVLELGERAALDSWMARRRASAARNAEAWGIAAEMETELAARMSTPLERASILVGAAELRAASNQAANGIRALSDAVQASPQHWIAAESLAFLAESGGDHRVAAEALTAAALATQVPSHAAALWYRSGILWQEQVGDEERALDALRETARIDVLHEDVFSRLRNLLELREDWSVLADLIAARIDLGGDREAMLDLQATKARICEKNGDREGAKFALRALLEESPERAPELRRLAELCLESGEYRSAAEALIRIARIRKDRDELRWVFFALGEIYDQHIPDPKRAEAAFRRVLKLSPDDLPAMERLAALFQREGQLAEAVEVLSELARLEPDPDLARNHQLTLVEVLLAQGDTRRAEQTLDLARRNNPTDLAVLRALIDFYDRQNAQSAAAVHLNRAVLDLRESLARDPSLEQTWITLADVLRLRGRLDAARAVASIAHVYAIQPPELASLVDPSGAALGAEASANDPALDELLAPWALSSATRQLFALAGANLEKVLPFDPRAYRAEKAASRDPLRTLALEIGRWFGIADVEVWVSPTSPRACMPVSTAPVSLLLGRDLLAVLQPAERVFAFVRALKIASSGLAVAVRTQPNDLTFAIAGLANAAHPSYQMRGVDPAHTADWSKRISRQLGRRMSELAPLVGEMVGSPDFDPTRLAMLAMELGDRIGLVAGGSAPAAITALLKLSGEQRLADDSDARIAQIAKYPEVQSLADFAISDLHFDARARAVR